MLSALIALGQRLREQDTREGKVCHNAISTKEKIAVDIVIKEDGTFLQFITHEPKETLAEAITIKKGKARLIVDSVDRVLDIILDKKTFTVKKSGPTNETTDSKKSMYQLYLEKLREYEDVPCMLPIKKFYSNEAGLNKAKELFLEQVEDKAKVSNLAFRVLDSNTYVNEDPSLLEKIKEKYGFLSDSYKNNRACSYCGKNPISKECHPKIKNVPLAQPTGASLISYNCSSFKSYSIGKNEGEEKGNNNENAFMCSTCIKDYTTALNYLLTPYAYEKTKKGKKRPLYKNRINLGETSCLLFWSKKEVEFKSAIDLLTGSSSYDEEKIKLLMNSIYKQKNNISKLEENNFYFLIVSGNGGRAVPLYWKTTSESKFKTTLLDWFEEVQYINYEGEKRYYTLFELANFDDKQNDYAKETIIKFLYGQALGLEVKAYSFILGELVNRFLIAKSKEVSNWKLNKIIVLLKLLYNRNLKDRGMRMSENIELEKQEVPFLCGRLFRLLEYAQYKSQGKLNASIVGSSKYCASTPSTGFSSLLFDVVGVYLVKINKTNPAIAGFIRNELQKYCTLIKEKGGFPSKLSKEEQSEFILGYFFKENNATPIEEVETETEEEMENE